MDETEILREELAKLKDDHQIELLLAKNGVKSLKAAMAIFDKDSLSRSESGEYENLDNAISVFKNENSWLFENPVSTLSTAISHGRGSGKICSEMTDEKYYTALREKRNQR